MASVSYSHVIFINASLTFVEWNAEGTTENVSSVITVFNPLHESFCIFKLNALWNWYESCEGHEWETNSSNLRAGKR